jgi:hypothetical protein
VRRLAWSLLGLYVVLSGAGLALLAQVPAEALERQDASLVLDATFVGVMLVFALVGAVVASRLPGNAIGWLFLALALLEALYVLAFGYAQHALHGGDLPGARYAAWVSNWASPLTPLFVIHLLLRFPDGRPVSPRWRVFGWACVPLAALILADYALAPGPIEEFGGLTNPLSGPEWLAPIDADVAIFVLLLGAAASLIVRFRRSHGVERQQVKWIAYAAGIIAAFILFSGIATVIFDADGATNSDVAGFIFAGVFSGLPVAAGLAILRHGLYDIDVVIKRTLVYGALTAILAATYLGSVLLLGLALGPVTEDSKLAVAGSTLAVAAMFGPARARVQAVVDRRFYRSRYDAVRTLEAFAGRLRDEIDLDALGTDLRGVVRETLQPAHVSLWLRSAP